MSPFPTDTVVQSRSSGARVRVTGPGRFPGTFAGRYLSPVADRFDFTWDAWNESIFDPAPPEPEKQ